MTTATVVGLIVVASGACFASAAGVAARSALLRRAGAPAEVPSPRRAGRSGSALLGRVGCVVAVVGALPLAGPAGAVVTAGCLLVVPRALRRRRSGSARSALEAQLAAAVAAVAAALRAGLSLSQSIRFAAEEADPPVSDALRAVVEREDLGLPLQESLARWTADDDSADVRLVADVLGLHVGSGLPRVLDHVRTALRDRDTSRREVRSLTAQARLSGTILGLLPIGFFVFLSVISRRDMTAAYSTPYGLAAIVVGIVLDGLAFLWIRKLVAVEA